jgi:2,4-dienoyl-CoA reductase-like NADH-dependent reductase (Old Yellow Enzyme family)
MVRASVWDPLVLRCGMTLAHRFILAPMTTDSSNIDGTVSTAELAYIDRRAANEFAAFITSCAYVDPDGRAWQSIGASGDQHLSSLSSVAAAFGSGDAVRILQLYDGGRLASPDLVSPERIRAPSAVASSRPGARVPRALAGAEVEGIIDSFVRAAQRGIQVGFDGVELHGANHYLIHQFFSPRSNQRDDRWGGDPDRRMAFALEIAARVREAVGARRAVGFRLNPFEVERGGFTLDDSIELARKLSHLGIDYLHISMDNFRKNSPQPEDRDWTRSVRSQDGRSPIEAIANAVNGRCAVVASGGIQGQEHAQAAMDLGADLLAIGRAALIDPEWLRKVQNGSDSTIRRLMPATSAEIEAALTIPTRMAQYLLSRPGWIPTEQGLQPTSLS